MAFEESALVRLRRYREEANRSLGLMRESREIAYRFSERLFAGLEYTAKLGREAGFEIEADRTETIITLRVIVSEKVASDVTFVLVEGVAGETDEDLMHEELSRHTLDPSGYSGRILGWTEDAGEKPCQTFAIYRDGVWKTKGLFVARARGGVNDSDDVLNGFCLRILGRLIDLAAMTGGAGRSWTGDAYSLRDRLEGREPPTQTRWPR